MHLFQNILVIVLKIYIEYIYILNGLTYLNKVIYLPVYSLSDFYMQIRGACGETSLKCRQPINCGELDGDLHTCMLTTILCAW